MCQPDFELPMTSQAPTKIQISSGSVKRILKDLQLYQTELQKAELDIKTLTKANADEFAIRQQNKVCKETAAMLPEMTKQLEKAIYRLEQDLKSSTDPPEELESAREQLLQAKSLIE